MTEHPLERESDTGVFDPERDLTKQDWGRINLEHYLVKHTDEHIREITESLNSLKPEILYLELVGMKDFDRRGFERLLNGISHGEIEWEEYKKERVAFKPSLIEDLQKIEKAFAFKLVSKIDFPAEISYVDVADGDIENGNLSTLHSFDGMLPQSFEECYQTLKVEAKSIMIRDSFVTRQLVNSLGDKLICRSDESNISAALVTGAAHTKISTELRKFGMKVRREYVTDLTDANRVTKGHKLSFNTTVAALRTLVLKGDSEGSRLAFARAYIAWHTPDYADNFRAVDTRLREMPADQLMIEVERIDGIKAHNKKSKFGKFLTKLTRRDA